MGLCNLFFCGIPVCSTKHRWARGGGERRGNTPPPTPPDVQKSAPPKPTTYLLLFPPLSGWQPEATEKMTIFVQNCQKFCLFRRVFPPQKGKTCPPPGGKKTTLPRPKFGWSPSQLPTPPMVRSVKFLAPHSPPQSLAEAIPLWVFYTHKIAHSTYDPTSFCLGNKSLCIVG